MGNVLTEEGYIVYTRETASYKWEKIRQFKQKEVENLMGKIPNANDNYWLKIADNLEALGKNERARELALLQQGLGEEVSVDDEYKFIDQFNQVIIGVDLYERALKQIKLSKQQFDEGKKTMAPVISSLYMSKLKTRLGKTLVQFVQEHEQVALFVDHVAERKSTEIMVDFAVVHLEDELELRLGLRALILLKFFLGQAYTDCAVGTSF